MHRVPPFKRKRLLRAGVLTLLSLLSLLACATWFRPPEPSYHGKPVSRWFQEFASGRVINGSATIDRTGRHLFSNNTEIPDPALKALVALGEPAIDYLGRQISARNLLNAPLYSRLYTNLPLSLRGTFLHPLAAETRRIDAATALISFGSKAQKQVPAIVDVIIRRSGYPGNMLIGILPLLDLPRSEAERLLTALVKQSRYAEARQALDTFSTRSPVVARLVAEMLAKGGSGDIWYFERLREYGSDAAVALPALLTTIASTNAEIRYQTLRTLETIGPSAAQALPALKTCANDENSMVQSAAKRAIKAIADLNTVAQ